MALSAADKELVSGFADEVHIAASWMSGPRRARLTDLARRLEALASGTPAAEIDPEPEERRKGKPER
jgi:hypothetical protein